VDQQLWGTKEVAAYLGVSEKTALRRMRDGRVPAERVGKLWRASPDVVRRLFEHKHHAPPAAADYDKLAPPS